MDRIFSASFVRFLLVLAIGLLACSGTQRPNGRLRNLARPATPTRGIYVVAHPLAHLTVPGAPRALVPNGRALHACLNNFGLSTVDIANPESPVITSHLPGANTEPAPGHYYFSLLVEPGRLISADRHKGITVLDAADPLHPKFLWTTPIPADDPVDLLRAGDFYFIAGGRGGVFRLPKSFDAHTTATRVPCQFDYSKRLAWIPPHWLLLADSFDGGLKIFNAADPLSPQLRHVFQTGNFCDGVTRLGSRAAILNRNTGLMILNMERPADPYLESYFIPFSADPTECLAVWRKDRVLLGNRAGFVDVIDLEHPHRPLWLARVPTRGGVTALTCIGDTAYIGTNRPGGPNLLVYKLEEKRQ